MSRSLWVSTTGASRCRSASLTQATVACRPIHLPCRCPRNDHGRLGRPDQVRHSPPDHTGRMPIDRVIRGGTVFDGSGAPGVRADVAIEGDRITLLGALPDRVDADVIDATGLAVTPGFINVLSHAWGSLQLDPSGASDLLQGVTTEVFGEAFSLGPGGAVIGEAVRMFDIDAGMRLDFDRLSDGLTTLERNGVAPNVASFVGGHNLRLIAAGFDDRPLTAAEIDHLRGVVEEEMQDGALGIGTALIYPPGHFATTDELVALCEVVGTYDGVYISHLRSEGTQFLEC